MMRGTIGTCSFNIPAKASSRDERIFLQRVSCVLKAQQFHSPGLLGDEGDARLNKNALGFRSVSLCAPWMSRYGLKARKYLAQGKQSGALGWGQANVATP